MSAEPRVAFVHDWLVNRGGSERFLEAAMRLYPQAELFTTIYNAQNFGNDQFAGRKVHASFVDGLPLAKRHYRAYVPLMPFAIEQFDFRSFDLVISSSHAVAHGVLPQPDQLHINYVHSPARYAWQLYHEYAANWRIGRARKSWLAKAFLHYLRLWDFAAAARVDDFIANSQWVAKSIRRAYRREAQVIYPPVRVEAFEPGARRENYYITVCRLVPYKRVDLIVEAFNQLPFPLIIVGEGPEYKRLAGRAKPNIQFLVGQTDEQVAGLLGRAKGFVYAAVEDFGIAAVEAQAAGCPVIAYARGGLTDTVVNGKTGLLYLPQTAQGLIAAITQFEDMAPRLKISDMRSNAERFGVERFEREFTAFVSTRWEEFHREN